jgi:hypothetical protein
MGGACNTLGGGETRIEYNFSPGKPQGKRRRGRPRHRCEDGVRIDLREVGWGGVDWIHLAQDRDQWRALANTVINCRVP